MKPHNDIASVSETIKPISRKVEVNICTMKCFHHSQQFKQYMPTRRHVQSVKLNVWDPIGHWTLHQ